MKSEVEGRDEEIKRLVEKKKIDKDRDEKGLKIYQAKSA